MPHRILPALALGTFIAAFLAVVSAASTPIGEIEEHFEPGRQWRETGAFPAVLRPPGYPGFVALTLLARDGLCSTQRPGRNRRLPRRSLSRDTTSSPGAS